MSHSVRITVRVPGNGAEAGTVLKLALEQELRRLPGRRQVYRARLETGEVILAKGYEHPGKAPREAAREWKALRLLQDKGLPVPAPEFWGVDDAGNHWVGMGFIEGAISMKQALEEGAESQRRERMKALVALVHQCHDAGVWQSDLHLDNFLLGKDEGLWMIDAESVRGEGGELTQRRRVRNWALLRANLLLRQKASFDEGFSESESKELFDAVVKATPGMLGHRLRRYRKKCQRTCSEFESVECGDGTMIRRREIGEGWLSDLVRALPEDLEKHARVLKRASRCLVVAGHREGVDWVLKVYWRPRWQRTGRWSRARRSWVAGNGLRLLGIQTPEPLAFWERSPGDGTVVDGLLMRLDDGLPLQEWVRSAPSEAQWRRLTSEVTLFFEALEELQASHGDTKASNFHVGPEGDLRVIDLDSFHWGGWRWRRRRAKDRERFARNARKFPQGKRVFSLLGAP